MKSLYTVETIFIEKGGQHFGKWVFANYEQFLHFQHLFFKSRLHFMRQNVFVSGNWLS